jgi:hypothetical protein
LPRSFSSTSFGSGRDSRKNVDMNNGIIKTATTRNGTQN